MFALFPSIGDGVVGCKIQLSVYRMYLMLLFDNIPSENGCNRYQGILYLLGQLPKKVSLLHFQIGNHYFTTNTDQNSYMEVADIAVFFFYF